MTRRLALASLSVGQPMGQQVYERELEARAQAELGSDWSVDVIGVRSLRSPSPGTVRLPSALLIDAPAALRRAAGRVIYRGHDVVHRLDLRLPPAPEPEVLTVHDVVQWRFGDEGTPMADAASSTRRAVAVICPSQFSADEVAAVLGVSGPITIHNGVHRRFFDAIPMTDTALGAFGITRPFVLHAGGCTERKNLAGLAAAWPLVHSVHPAAMLVLMGPADERRDRLFGPLPSTSRIGRVNDDDALGIMAAAAAIAVPSTYEGFGLPALEGMALGVPVVAADRSSLPEVCGDAALLVEPDGGGIADGLIAALDGGPDIAALVKRGRVRAKGYSWDASAATHAEVWRSMAG